MVKVIFKDVGQGDSIIFEWEDDAKKRIGIIDCKKKGKSNPILAHLKAADPIEQIDFIVLSHPHEDHYSGLYAVLKHCKDRKIKIKKFCYTIQDIEIEYWNYFSPNITGSKELLKIFDIAHELYDLKLLEFVPLSFGYRIDLTNEIYLKCISPSREENSTYLDILKFQPEKNRLLRSRAANHLSTLFKLKVGDKYILFTSDVEKQTFLRIQDRNWDLLDKKEVHLSQVPHHGSENNHEESFWSKLQKVKNCTALISAGEHKPYDHPHYNVISSFKNLGYDIQSTNIVNGMEKFVQEIKLKSLKLDTGSMIAEEYYNEGDKEFTYKISGI